MDLTTYRVSQSEKQRSSDLLRLMPAEGQTALDVGARDGYFSLLMADRFDNVVALDLTMPRIIHPKVQCVQCNAAAIPFPDNTFDFVFCAEVLEHIPTMILSKVCRELERVAKRRILLGVPYKQDIRVGRTTCYSCGKKNPPWGHLNSFDEQVISELFQQSKVDAISHVGLSSEHTNWLSSVLMDFAGNPYGTYDQEEPCVYCGRALLQPRKRKGLQLVATKLAFWSRNVGNIAAKPHGNWMHVVLDKASGL